MVGVNKNVCGFVFQFFTFTVFLFQQAIILEQNVRFECLHSKNKCVKITYKIMLQ